MQLGQELLGQEATDATMAADGVSAASLSSAKAKLIGDHQYWTRRWYRDKGVALTEKDCLDIASLRVSLSAVHVAEMYCPGRLAKEAKRFGLILGVAADLKATKLDGEPWGLLRREDLAELIGILEGEQSRLLV